MEVLRRKVRGAHEKDVPTQHPTAQEDPRIPRPNELQDGASGSLGPSPQGPQTSGRLRKGSAPREAYPKSNRLRKRQDFRACQKRGRRTAGRWMVLLTLENRGLATRLGLSIPRRAGSSPLRNLAKRRLREIFRRSSDLLPPSRDLCVILKPEAARAPYAALREEFRSLCEKAFSSARPSGS